MDIYKNMERLKVELPPAPAKGGVYMPVKKLGSKHYCFSGCGPQIGGQIFVGKLGGELSIEEGQKAARNCMLNALAALEAELGDLNKIKSFVKVLAFVASTSDFYNQPQIANGATGFLVEVFGEDIGCPTRSAISTNALPGNIPVEIEGIVEVD